MPAPRCLADDAAIEGQQGRGDGVADPGAEEDRNHGQGQADQQEAEQGLPHRIAIDGFGQADLELQPECAEQRLRGAWDDALGDVGLAFPEVVGEEGVPSSKKLSVGLRVVQGVARDDCAEVEGDRDRALGGVVEADRRRDHQLLLGQADVQGALPHRSAPRRAGGRRS